MLIAKVEDSIKKREQALLRRSLIMEEVGPFNWGLDYFNISNRENPKEALFNLLEEFELFEDGIFTIRAEADVVYQTDHEIKFVSSEKTNIDPNDIAIGKLFHAKKRTKEALIFLTGHWGSSRKEYTPVIKMLNKKGFDVFYFSLPFHDERKPESYKYPYPICGPNLGLTLKTFQQAVLDCRWALKYLRARGYQEFNSVGVSLGASVGSIISSLEADVSKSCLTFLGTDFGDFIFKSGLLPKLKSIFEEEFTHQEAKKVFRVLSPMHYFHKLNNKEHKLTLLYGKYDSILPDDVHTEVETHLIQNGVNYYKKMLPNGHFTLADFPMNLMWSYQLFKALK